MLVGRGAARVRDLFKRGLQCAPCIIFIDELDALAKRGCLIVQYVLLQLIRCCSLHSTEQWWLHTSSMQSACMKLLAHYYSDIDVICTGTVNTTGTTGTRRPQQQR
eukprot:8273-Heterococcus_DN1.PRE.3